jgi:twitching motility protein PilT
MQKIDRFLRLMNDHGASDFHLTVGRPPMLRASGTIETIRYRVISEADFGEMLEKVTPARIWADYVQSGDVDFSYEIPGVARYRVNLFRQQRGSGAVFRIIPTKILSIEQLGLPEQIRRVAEMRSGLVLMTGPTGSGKSTTLAAIIDLINDTRALHIITIEDPIEFVHANKKSLIHQREVGSHATSFAEALKAAGREDPDIILVGEMRDLETISVALTAAETGHLVFATLHTQDAAQTIDRIIDVFPPGQQQQVRVQLAGTLQGIVCQTLARTTNGEGRAVATEVLVATPAVRNLIREGKTHQIYSAMQAGAKHGMHTMDQHLADLVKTGRISMETGIEKCHHIEDFNRLAGRA